jgi:hypothetical protein
MPSARLPGRCGGTSRTAIAEREGDQVRSASGESVVYHQDLLPAAGKEGVANLPLAGVWRRQRRTRGQEFRTRRRKSDREILPSLFPDEEDWPRERRIHLIGTGGSDERG